MALRTFFKTRKNVFLWRKLINSQSNDGISTWGNSKTTYSNLQGRELDTDLGGTISISSGLALVISVHIYWKQKNKKKRVLKLWSYSPAKLFVISILQELFFSLIATTRLPKPNDDFQFLSPPVDNTTRYKFGKAAYLIQFNWHAGVVPGLKNVCNYVCLLLTIPSAKELEKRMEKKKIFNLFIYFLLSVQSFLSDKEKTRVCAWLIKGLYIRDKKVDTNHVLSLWFVYASSWPYSSLNSLICIST